MCPYLIHATLSSPESITQTASRSVQPLCTAHCRKSLYNTMGAPFPKNCPFYEGPEPHLIRDSFGQSQPTSQTALPSVQLFCTYDRRVCPYFTMGHPSPSKLPLLMGDLGPIQHVFPASATQTASRSVQPFLLGLLV